MHLGIGQQSLTSGGCRWSPNWSRLVVIGLAVGRRPRRWNMLWLPIAALGGAACAVSVSAYIGSIGVAGGPLPRRLLCWLAASGFSVVVGAAGWGGARWWKRALSVVAVPACVLCAALMVNQWVGYCPTVKAAWGSVTAGPLPDQVDDYRKLPSMRDTTQTTGEVVRRRHRRRSAASGIARVRLPAAGLVRRPTAAALPAVMMIAGEFNTPADWIRSGDAVATPTTMPKRARWQSAGIGFRRRGRNLRQRH